MKRPSSPHLPDEPKAINPIAPLEDETDRLVRPNTQPLLLAIKARRRHNHNTNTVFDTTWLSEPVSRDPSMDQEIIPPIEETDTRHGST